jgi:hypothetical protein
MGSEPLAILIPASDEARARGCTCRFQEREGPPWTVDGNCPLHWYRAEAEDRALSD